ncbi:glycosyltransferase family 2 protein [Polaribacter aquimarinus]|uniref:Glycosyltransferase 2-like domain-containing protein n=1 Tax=Polaribacter aquimarinus TaxID=2100726 RepID=A0A2U2JBT1_9FLAO|nr:glycosyltransferase family 2 protein [Polaribacter aquimarinus]PWG05797.1 hypothetical protein DIS07_04960 [Polaribacter aquimarinus]
MNKICTVIIPVFNDFVRLEKAILSILNQKCNLKWDIIIIDDASDKNDYNTFFEKFKNNSIIRFFRNKVNLGPAFARNIGLDNAIGDYISFLDSDDCWSEERSFEFFSLICSSEVDLVWGQTKYFVDEGVNYSWYKNGDIVFKNLVGSIAYKFCKKLSKIRFDPSLRYGEDNDFWLQLVDKNVKIKKTNSIVLNRYIHGENMTFNKEFNSNKTTLELLKNRLKQK